MREFCLILTDKKSPAKTIAKAVRVTAVKVPIVKKSALKIAPAAKESTATESTLKAKRSTKVEAKAEVKQSKGVKFSEQVVEHVFGERRWNDFKTKGATFTKGTFTPDEVKTLMNALCAYVKEHTSIEADPMETLTILCSRSKTEMPAELNGAWPKISESL